MYIPVNISIALTKTET